MPTEPGPDADRSHAPVPTRPAAVAGTRLGTLASALGLSCPPAAVDVVLTGVSHASQSVRAGDLYVAVQGARTHGARFAAQAADAGALAVLTDAAGAALLGATRTPVLVADDPRSLLGPAASLVYDRPAEHLVVIGVTGTNGKTTVTSLLHSVLTSVHGRAGLVGTIETRIGSTVVPSVRTTPEASDLQALLAVMREQDVPAVAIEVSSHALALGRVGGLVVDVAGFTNLSQDHLDFHTTMEDYFETKAMLFTPDRSRCGVVVVDDEWGARLARVSAVPVTTLSTRPERSADVDWHVSDVAADGAGSRARLRDPTGRTHDLRIRMPGSVNVANAALTVALAAASGVDVDVCVAALAEAPMVPGRMELVSGEARPVVVVDYAHSPDALDTALASLRATSPAPLVVVVGAGGDRDTTKRAPMGRSAARGADLVVVTDDNPRSEDPATIRSAVLAGAREVDPSRVREVPDRREAIRTAVTLAGSGTVLVAGKGHEQGQDVAGVVHPFDDRVEARAALERRTGLAGHGDGIHPADVVAGQPGGGRP
jgi:UDP-N-acetylmuramoyl-L-alanyl-D-glutamate--2,6-diaminopimelate ligase